jgi:hypothetical protein
MLLKIKECIKTICLFSIIVTLLCVTYIRNFVWQDESDLWKSSDGDMSYYNLGVDAQKRL